MKSVLLDWGWIGPCWQSMVCCRSSVVRTTRYFSQTPAMSTAVDFLLMGKLVATFTFSA